MTRRGPATSRGGQARLALLAVLVAGFALAGIAAVLVSTQRGDTPREGPPRAVIVDQLSLTDPNPGFIGRASALLSAGGYEVEVVPHEQVTVDFYRELPKRGYDFIVLRSHAYGQRISVDPVTGQRRSLPQVGLTTAERYRDDRYIDEQRAHQLDVSYYGEGEARYFGIAAGFVAARMKGNFDGATVLLMGCDGLSSEGMAKALKARGAGAFVSWDERVTAAHIDTATERLLTLMFRDGATLADAVARTADEVGADPTYGGRLLLWGGPQAPAPPP